MPRTSAASFATCATTVPSTSRPSSSLLARVRLGDGKGIRANARLSHFGAEDASAAVSGMEATKTTRAGTLHRGSLSARYAFIASASVSSTESASSRRITFGTTNATRASRGVLSPELRCDNGRATHAQALTPG